MQNETIVSVALFKYFFRVFDASPLIISYFLMCDAGFLVQDVLIDLIYNLNNFLVDCESQRGIFHRLFLTHLKNPQSIKPYNFSLNIVRLVGTSECDKY